MAYNLLICKEVLDEINVIRSNPKNYAEKVADLLKYFKGNLLEKPGEEPVMTQEGTYAVEDCVRRLKSIEGSLPKLVWSDLMAKAAQAHSDDIGLQGKVSHEGSDGSTIESRNQKYGKWETIIAENLYFGPKKSKDIALSILINDGYPNRSHRENILNPELKCAGVGYGSHSLYGHVCTIDFAGGYSDFESNKNNDVQKIISKPEKEFDKSEISSDFVPNLDIFKQSNFKSNETLPVKLPKELINVPDVPVNPFQLDVKLPKTKVISSKDPNLDLLNIEKTARNINQNIQKAVNQLPAANKPELKIKSHEKKLLEHKGNEKHKIKLPEKSYEKLKKKLGMHLETTEQRSTEMPSKIDQHALLHKSSDDAKSLISPRTS